MAGPGCRCANGAGGALLMRLYKYITTCVVVTAAGRGGAASLARPGGCPPIIHMPAAPSARGASTPQRYGACLPRAIRDPRAAGGGCRVGMQRACDEPGGGSSVRPVAVVAGTLHGGTAGPGGCGYVVPGRPRPGCRHWGGSRGCGRRWPTTRALFPITTLETVANQHATCLWRRCPAAPVGRLVMGADCCRRVRARARACCGQA